MVKQLQGVYKAVRSGFVLLAAGLGTGCSNAPGTTYQLTPDQLAWQPYRTGQLLRFGNSSTPVVRTYRVLNVEDMMVEGPHSNGLVVIPFVRGKDPDQYQNIEVTVVRTDSAAAAFSALTLAADPGFSLTSAPAAPVYASAAWGGVAAVRLPIAEVNQGIAFDTLGLYPRTQLLPSLTLGPATYAQVIEGHQLTAATRTTTLYYAKGTGVVGFVERGTGLWFRLP